MKIACRWPGGITLALPRSSGNHVTFALNGPAGQPSVLPAALSRGAPSRRIATLAQKAVADTVKRMADTAGGEFAPHEFGVTDVPGNVWNEWYTANAGNDVITQNMVFALE